MEASRKKSHLVLAEKIVLTKRKEWQHFKTRNEYTPKKKGHSRRALHVMCFSRLLCSTPQSWLQETVPYECQVTLYWQKLAASLCHTSFAFYPRFSPTPQWEALEEDHPALRCYSTEVCTWMGWGTCKPLGATLTKGEKFINAYPYGWCGLWKVL